MLKMDENFVEINFRNVSKIHLVTKDFNLTTKANEKITINLYMEFKKPV
jgi:hypothetical protein